MVQDQDLKISIIIPCLNEAGFIEKTLERCLKLQGNFEIILVDGGSTDHTVNIAKKISYIKIFIAEKGRAKQMNYGSKKAEGDILLFLHADTFLPENTFNLIHRQFKKPETVGGSFRLKFDKPHRFLNLYTWFSRFSLEFFTYGDHAFFIKKEIFDTIGGYKFIPFMEDIEIQKRLRKKGKFKKVKEYVVTSGRRFEKNGTTKQLVIDVILVCLYNLSISPRQLKQFYADHN